MDKSVKIILVIVGGVAALAVAVCIIVGIFVFSIVNKQKKADYYTLGNDQIASVKLAVGERNIVSVSTRTANGVTTKEYEYKSSTSASDIEQYEAYLQEQEGFIITTLNDEKQIFLGKNSADEGKILIVEIVDTHFGYILTIRKGEGGLEMK